LAPETKEDQKTEVIFAPKPSDNKLVQEKPVTTSNNNPTSQAKAAVSKTEETVSEKIEPEKTIVEAKPKTVSPATKPAKKVASKKPETSKVVPENAVRIQLGALRDKEKARDEWRRLSRRYAPALDGLTFDTVRVDLGEKGIFYRLHGLVKSSAEATKICDQIKASKGACFIVK